MFVVGIAGSEEYTIILDSYRTDTDARTIMTATGVPWARWNTCTVKIVETWLTYAWTLPPRKPIAGSGYLETP